MSKLPDLDAFLDSTTDRITDDLEAEAASFLDESLGEASDEAIEIVVLEEGEVDPRLKNISHSSRTMLHTCPRKYQLDRLKARRIAADHIKEVEQGVTFAYGSAVGVGVQSVLEDKSEDQVILDTFLEWDVDLLDETPRQKKSFWLAVFAVQKFMSMRQNGFLDDYELVYYNGKPAVELSFQVILPNNFRYRGYVDAVLRHKTTGAVLVLENKTSSGTAQAATYKNSGQAVGYSVVLDIMFPGLSSYEVLYMVYETKTFRYVELPFGKTLLQRALWLQELLIDCNILELYESYETYPMHGESCYSFFKDCEYLGLCTLPTDKFTKPLTTKMLADLEKERNSYDFTVDFYDLVDAQIAKGEEV